MMADRAQDTQLGFQHPRLSFASQNPHLSSLESLVNGGEGDG